MLGPHVRARTASLVQLGGGTVDLLASARGANSLDPLLSGGAIAILAFALATARDLWTRRQDSNRRQRLAMRAFEQEMSSNRGAAGNNLTLIAVERSDIDSGSAKALLNTLSRLESGAWSVARLDLPTGILENQNLLRRLQIINRNTYDINSLIESRENFRIQHLGHDALLVDGLKKYGGILTHLLSDLLERLDEAVAELNPYLKRSG